jgi:hypothetical protein
MIAQSSRMVQRNMPSQTDSPFSSMPMAERPSFQSQEPMKRQAAGAGSLEGASDGALAVVEQRVAPLGSSTKGAWRLSAEKVAGFFEVLRDEEGEPEVVVAARGVIAEVCVSACHQ